MEETLIYCRGEGHSFPAKQFRRNQDGDLCVPYIHKVPTPHDEFGMPVDFEGCHGGGGGGSGDGMMAIPDLAPMD